MFTNKTILITGGSSGIGEIATLMFAQNGADVVFTYKSNKKGAVSLIEKVRKLGRKVIAIQADLINESEAKKVVSEAIEKFGKIDVLVNNAGRYINGDEWNGASDIWLESLQQNLISMMNVSKYTIEVFQKQKSGVIISVASRHGLDGQYDAISYAAAKAGVINITQAYSKLLFPFGRANSISPSATNAGYWLTAPKEEVEETLLNKPNHKLVEPETIAKKIIFLASDESRNVTGQNFSITE